MAQGRRTDPRKNHPQRNPNRLGPKGNHNALHLLERDKEDGTLLAKCVEELKKKGIKFDLLKEVDTLRRAKSLRVEAKAVRKWSARDFATLYFFAMSCLVLGITRVIDCLCGGGHDNQKEEAGREEEERGGQRREK
ncbi:hypothetical protein FH972_010899 [Carpinus fangiana]|uniref:Uncharacterized protein n=1 Tax=Carpinus fangiana TaxID=176857 RepID=A0A660KRP0_9ROSI|nr:hypothetical protein FH972_010899 [Carpinus fangiana]